MAAIDPDGLFGGERLAALSDKARLYWPWLYTASNGFARLELNPMAIIKRCFANFNERMTVEQLIVILTEYQENFLLFTYQSNGKTWIQFDTPAKFLPRHKTAKDRESPDPDPAARDAFDCGYAEWKRPKSFTLQQFRKNEPLFPQIVRGIGSGIGIGIGIGSGSGTGIGDAPAIQNCIDCGSGPCSMNCGPSVERAQQAVMPAPAITPQPRHVSPTRLLAPMDSPDVSTIVRQIVVAHPRSMDRKQRFGEITDSQSCAVIQAMEDEIAATDGVRSAMECLEFILARVNMQAAAIPPAEHKFFKEVEKYFQLHEYRLEPESFMRKEPTNGNGNRAQARTNGNINAVEDARRIRARLAAAGSR